MEAPDYLNRVAGVRIWRVAPNLWAQLGGLLWAPSVKEPWPTGEEHEAVCTHNPDHAPPEDGCMCGIYAFYTPDLAVTGGYWPVPWERYFTRLVAGVVGAAGDIELCEHGMRASRASVEAIFTFGAPDEELPIPRAEIAQGYGAAVIDARDYEAFCAERGLVVINPDDL